MSNNAATRPSVLLSTARPSVSSKSLSKAWSDMATAQTPEPVPVFLGEGLLTRPLTWKHRSCTSARALASPHDCICFPFACITHKTRVRIGHCKCPRYINVPHDPLSACALRVDKHVLSTKPEYTSLSRALAIDRMSARRAAPRAPTCTRKSSGRRSRGRGAA